MRLPLVPLLLAVWVIATASASGHATVRDVAPTDGEVAVTLSAPAESAFLRSDRGNARLDPDDPQIVLVTAPGPPVTLTILSRDGHVTTAQIGEGGARATADPVTVTVGRALMLAALLLVCGLGAVVRFVLAPATRAPLRPFGAAVQPAPELIDEQIPRIRRATLAAGGVGVLGAGLIAGGTLSRLGSSDLVTLLRDTRLGHVLVVALVALLAAAVAWGMGRDRPLRTMLTASTAAAAGLLAVSAGGHATSGTDALLGGAFDAAHTLATALWVAGLGTLVVGVPYVRRRLSEPRATGILAAVVVRFSALGIGCVATLVVTGFYRALGELRGLSDLVETAYGRTLLVKLVVFALMLAIAGINRLALHPRLERAAIGLAEDDRGAARALGRSVRAELALAAVVVALVAILAAFPPP